MPLSEKTRIEDYLPDLPAPAYRRLLDGFEIEVEQVDVLPQVFPSRHEASL